MNFFELSWSWHEDYQPHVLAHESKTKEEFDVDVKELMVKYGPEYLAQEGSWASAPKWIDFVVKKLPERGYIPIVPECFNVFGAYIIEGDDRDDGEFGNVVGSDLLNKAIAHNQNVKARLNKERVSTSHNSGSQT